MTSSLTGVFTVTCEKSRRFLVLDIIDSKPVFLRINLQRIVLILENGNGHRTRRIKHL